MFFTTSPAPFLLSALCFTTQPSQNISLQWFLDLVKLKLSFVPLVIKWRGKKMHKAEFVPLWSWPTPNEEMWLALWKYWFFSALWWDGSLAVKLSFSQGECWEMQHENCGWGFIGHTGRLTDGSLRLVMKPRRGCTASNSVWATTPEEMSGVNAIWMKLPVSFSKAWG